MNADHHLTKPLRLFTGHCLIAGWLLLLGSTPVLGQYLINTQQTIFNPPFWVGAPYACAGDFNNNGYPDVLYIDTSAHHFYYLADFALNGFSNPVHYVLPWGTPVGGLSAPCTADFNGDGNLDFAVALDSTVTGLFVIYGNGIGGFSPLPGSPLPVADPANWVKTSDLNHDGRPDLVCLRYSATGASAMSVLVNTGTGWTQTMDLPLPTAISPVAFGDFDGDGNGDLAWRSGWNSSFPAVFGRSFFVAYGNGDGTFQVPMNFDVGIPMTQFGFTTALAAADFDLDGYTDMVVSTSNSSTPAVLRLLLGRPGRTFSSPINLGSPANNVDGPLQIIVGDFTGDGISDLLLSVVYDVPSVALVPLIRFDVVQGFGNGQFSASAMITEMSPLLPEEPKAIVADFDLDGDLDIYGVTTFNYETYFENRSIASRGMGGTLPPPVFTVGTGALGNGAFLASVFNAPPSAMAVLGVASARLPNPLPPSGLLLDLAAPAILLPAMTDAVGVAQLPIPLPATPSLHGTTFFTQWAVADPLGVSLGSTTLTLSVGRTVIVW